MIKERFAFEDDDRTVIRPPPGRGWNSDVSPASQTRESVLQSIPALSGINPLEKAASRLLPLLVTIKHSTSHRNPEQLRNFLIKELNDFKTAAHEILNDQKKVTQASYIMCTALDEAAMNTPWGHKANWAQHNLLTTFHNEVIGGERFFDLLKGLSKQPNENIDLLELMYVCLALGYEGNYRIAHNGHNTLAKVRTWLHDIIRNCRSTPEPELSIQWAGTGLKENKLPRFTVLWVLCAAALALSSIFYIGYRYNLSARSDSAIAGFFNISPAELQISSVVPPERKHIGVQGKTLEQLLQTQIDAGLIEVESSYTEGMVRLLGDNLFSSGKTALNSELDPLVQEVVSALNQFAGPILVTGHSDNIPIRSGRYTSNLELSRQRALSVAERIEAAIDNPERVTAEGRGSLEPIADNSTRAGRATNRRVEITLFY